MAATVEESTPPDMATAMVLEGGIWRLAFGIWQLALSPQHSGDAPGIVLISGDCLDLREAKCQLLIANCCSIVNRRQVPEASYGFRHEVESELNVVGTVLLSQAETQTGAGYFRRQSHGR